MKLITNICGKKLFMLIAPSFPQPHVFTTYMCNMLMFSMF